jgi:hypothetical protein
MSTAVQSASAFYSTHLNSKVTTFDTLSERISLSLGYPLIDVDAHANQINEYIGISCDMFTKFAGYTEENLVFNSTLYEAKKGINLQTLFSSTPGLSALYDGVSGGHDPLLNAPRKVVDVWSFEEGSSSGINTLFTIEQSLAQQTYFSYSMGNYGFDLISWYTLKNWLDVREKILAQKRSFHFYPDSQYLMIVPEPISNQGFYGCIGAYVEKKLVDIIKEPWVYQYALALTKVGIGRVRGKFAGVQLFGGGTLNYTDLLQEGIAEKKTLEDELYNGAPGFGDAAPPQFFIG